MNLEIFLVLLIKADCLVFHSINTYGSYELNTSFNIRIDHSSHLVSFDESHVDGFKFYVNDELFSADFKNGDKRLHAQCSTGYLNTEMYLTYCTYSLYSGAEKLFTARSTSSYTIPMEDDVHLSYSDKNIVFRINREVPNIFHGSLHIKYLQIRYKKKNHVYGEYPYYNEIPDRNKEWDNADNYYIEEYTPNMKKKSDNAEMRIKNRSYVVIIIIIVAIMLSIYFIYIKRRWIIKMTFIGN